MSFKCGDVVLHRPTGEKWLIAAADENDVMWCGWPEGRARTSDCELIEQATPDNSADLHSRLTGARRAFADRVYGIALLIK